MLCRTTLEGFAALGVIAGSRGNPFSRHRDGLLLGEGAALFLMSREPAALALLGAGANSEAYHISAPRPDGTGAEEAMRWALQDAELTARQVDYLNLHGTGTRQNDAMEALAVHRLFGPGIRCGSSKGATGHGLGAAGAIEAGLCWLSLSELNPRHHLPPHVWDGAADPDLPALALVGAGDRSADPLRYCLSNSFAFGGHNVSLVLGRP